LELHGLQGKGGTEGIDRLTCLLDEETFYALEILLPYLLHLLHAQLLRTLLPMLQLEGLTYNTPDRDQPSQQCRQKLRGAFVCFSSFMAN